MLHTKSAPLVKQTNQSSDVSPGRTVTSPVNKSTTVVAQNSELPCRSKSDIVQSTHEQKPVHPLTTDHVSGMGGDCVGFEPVSGVTPENSISTGNSVDDFVDSTDHIPVPGNNCATVAEFADGLSTEQQTDLVGGSSEESVSAHNGNQPSIHEKDDVRPSQSCADLTSSVSSMDLDCAASVPGMKCWDLFT
jgi:hypothetical protein